MNSESKLETVKGSALEIRKTQKFLKSVSLIKRRNWKDAGLFTLFVGPVLLAFTLIVLIPFFTGIYYAFTDWNGVTGAVKWVGLG